MKSRSLKLFGSLLGFEKEGILSKADLSRVPFMVTHSFDDNSGFMGLSRRKLDVYVCYSRMTDKETVDTLMEKLSQRIKERGMEAAVDLASAKISGKGIHDTVVTIGSKVVNGLDSCLILDEVDKALDDLLYDAMFQAKRDFTKPHIS